MRAIDGDALYKDICDSLNEMTRIGIAVDGEWLWGKLNDSLENAPTIEPEPHWISCSERLPEEPFACLVTVMDYNPTTCEEFENILPYFVGYDGGHWYDFDGEECPCEILAWQRLPKTYKVGE